MSTFDPLRVELDLWAAADKVATLWWRDDDADFPTDGIRRMLDLSQGTGTTVVVAAVPAKADDALGPVLLGCPTAVVVQHGFAHRDHSPADIKGKWELGLHRPLESILDELRMGWTRLSDLLGDRLRPMLVPPWNRIDSELIKELPGMGYTTLSTFEPRSAAEAAPGLRRVNCHCDVIAWKQDRKFIGEEKTVDRLVEHLQARRLEQVDSDEPTGLLTHVWANDEDAWTTLGAVLEIVADHPGGRWLDQAGLAL